MLVRTFLEIFGFGNSLWPCLSGLGPCPDFVSLNMRIVLIPLGWFESFGSIDSFGCGNSLWPCLYGFGPRPDLVFKYENCPDACGWFEPFGSIDIFGFGNCL